MRRSSPAILALAALSLLVAGPASAADWSVTELQLQYGSLDTPTFAGGGTKDTLILTFQHASGWKYGENFVFFDVSSAEGGGFNDTDIYGEWYAYFSTRALGGREMGSGALRDVRLIAALNWAPDADVVKYLPGIGLSWNAKGFAFLNTDFTAYIDDSVGIDGGGSAPSEDDTFMIDVNWKALFGNDKFSIEGHAEYIGERTDEFGQKVEAWILAQPQFRYYLTPSAAVGIEYQYWMNKLGDPDTDESAVQALFVWVF